MQNKYSMSCGCTTVKAKNTEADLKSALVQSVTSTKEERRWHAQFLNQVDV